MIEVLPQRRRQRSDLINMAGQRFGRWVVESHVGCLDGATTRWLCLCACGKRKVVQRSSLISGRSTSCGCMQRDPNRPDKWTREKNVICQKEYRARNREQRRLELIKWREKHPVQTKALHRKHYFRSQYGLELEQIEQLLHDQCGRCAICQHEIKLGGRAGAKVDHCHKTNKVRGILCSRCNTSLGGFKDDPIILSSAIAYLKQPTVVSG